MVKKINISFLSPLKRGFATGDKYYGTYKFLHNVKTDLEKQGKNADVIEKHFTTSIEDENGNHVVDHIATHSSIIIEKGKKLINQMVGDGKTDIMGKSKPQFINAHPHINGAKIPSKALADKDAKFESSVRWVNYSEEHQIRYQQLLSKQKTLLQLEDNKIDEHK